MSSYLAISTITEAMRRLIQTAFLDVGSLSAGPQVTTGRPMSEDSGQVPEVGANIYLYQVTPNANLRNQDLPTRRDDGSLILRPQAALDLSYLLTFYGREEQLEPQRLLGKAVVTLHGKPVFTPDDLHSLIHGEEAVPYLVGSELGRLVEPVHITPVTLSLEELSKIWTVFFQATHRLSVAYQASVVLLESDLVPERALPARRMQLSAPPRLPPHIDSVTPPYLPYGEGATVTLAGERLAAENVAIEIGSRVAQVAAIDGGTVRATLPTDIAAGRVAVRALMGPVGKGVAASGRTFIVQPVLEANIGYRIQKGTSGGEEPTGLVSAVISPDLDADQPADLLLNQWRPQQEPARSYVFPRILRFSIDPARAADLANGPVESAVATAFRQNGFPLSAKARVTTVEPDGVWRIQDPGALDDFAIRRVRNSLIVTYGLAPEDNPRSTVFAIDVLPSGTYLVRIWVDRIQYAESPLVAGAARFETGVRGVRDLDAGKIPGALRKAFATHDVTLGDGVSVRRRMEGEWVIYDGDNGSEYLVRQSNVLTIYAIDAPDAEYLGPVVNVP